MYPEPCVEVQESPVPTSGRHRISSSELAWVGSRFPRCEILTQLLLHDTELQLPAKNSDFQVVLWAAIRKLSHLKIYPSEFFSLKWFSLQKCFLMFSPLPMERPSRSWKRKPPGLQQYGITPELHKGEEKLLLKHFH